MSEFSVTLPKEEWEQVLNLLQDKHFDLKTKASRSEGVYKEILTFEAISCLTLIQNMEFELDCPLID